MSCLLQDGRSPLLVATEEGHTDVVDILVTHGVDVHNVRNFT